MTLPCPRYAPVSGSHFSQLLITRQCRVLPLPTSCQPFPPSLTSRATQPPPSPQGVASFNLAQFSCPAYLLPQSHPFQPCKIFLLHAHSVSFLDAPSPQWHLYYRSFHARLAYNCFKLVPAGLSLRAPERFMRLVARARESLWLLTVYYAPAVSSPERHRFIPCFGISASLLAGHTAMLSTSFLLDTNARCFGLKGSSTSDA